MKKIASFLLVFCLASCAADTDGFHGADAVVPAHIPSLTEKVQKLVVAQQENYLENLPDEISSLKADGGISVYEKNNRGAGFSRAYKNEDGSQMLTVFVYNGFDFGVSDGVTEQAKTAFDAALSRFKTYEDTGLYKQVKIADPLTREMKSRTGKAYEFLRTTVSFVRDGERRVSYVALIPSRKLMSYVRLQLTYPNSFRAAKLQNAALRAVINAAEDLPDEERVAVGF